MTASRQGAAELAARHSTEPLLVTDADRVIFANPAFCHLVGVPADEVVGRGVDQIITVLDEPMVVDRLRNALRQHQPFHGEAACHLPDGRHIPVDLTVIPVESGATELFVVSATDRRHLKRLELQLRQSQRLDAVTQLADGISHELNEAIQIISGIADLAARGPDEARLTGGDLMALESAGRRAAKLLTELLVFARPGTPVREPVDLNEVIARWEPLLQAMIGTQVHLIVDLGAVRSPILADPAELQQVLINLVTNARDAMPGDGTLTITTHEVTAAEALDAGAVDSRVGAYVVLTVADTGTGMSAETRSQLFQPFFTTKGERGTRGLGLATVQEIVREVGGLLWVRTREQQGTSVEVHFPALAEVARPAETTDEPPPPRGGTETILLVDDDPGVLIVARRGLEQFGYRVVTASSAAEATAIAAERGREIRLLLTDVMMPGQRGTGLAQELTGDWPDLRVLFISGYPGEEAAEMMRQAPYLSKPFLPDELARAVRATLDA
ncbi:MAG: ATP-binding protein [Gemmatimonadales bacterium]